MFSNKQYIHSIAIVDSIDWMNQQLTCNAKSYKRYNDINVFVFIGWF